MTKTLQKLILAAACLMPCASAMAQEPTAGEEIDLGLSVNWRGYNIGANTPEEKGSIYAFASTKAGAYTSQYSYPFFNTMTWLYSFPEGSVAGDTQYDAAALETDGRWRLATKAQWEELVEGCDIVAYSYNGVDGVMLKSKANGNSIFLPSSTLGYSTTCSYYTSENNGSMPYVAKMAISEYHTTSVGPMESSYNSGPWNGLPLRAVCDRYEGPALEAIALAAEKTEIFAGTSTQITAASVPADVPMSLTYASSDESVAVVSSKGFVSAPYGSKGGKVAITVASGEITSTIEINVVAVETDFSEKVVDLGLSVDWCSYDLGAADYKANGDAYPFCYVNQAELENAFSYTFYRTSSLKYDFPMENFCGNVGYDAVAYAANHKMGYAGERLPSKEEMQELIDNCEAHYSCTGDASAPESREMLLVSKANGKAIRFPMSASSQIYYSGSTNADKNEAYCLYLAGSSASAKVQTSGQPWMSQPLRGVTAHSTTPALERIELSVTEGSIYEENTIQLTASAVPVGAELGGLEWASSDESIATVSAAGLVKGMSPGEAVITATSGNVSASASITVKGVNLTQGETVDMGTDVLWASRELNAPSQTENGGYYMFGNLTPMRGASSYQSSWVDPEVDVIGGTEYDPAHAELGGNWRMPTRSELLAMASKCEIEWITYGGHRGVLLTSVDTDNRIFCPLPSGTTYIFYMGDKMARCNSSDGSPTVEGLYISPTQAAMNSVRAWRACPILPVYDATLGISDIEEAADEITAVYTLDGRVLPAASRLRPGVYIIRYSSGKIRKEAVK